MAAAADIALLDLDGVLFAHPAAFALVHRRVERFVARHLVVPGRASSTGRAGARVAPVHDALYRRYGHTLLGLRAEHGCTATVRDFNRSVFNPAFVNAVRAMPLTPAVARQAAAAREAVQRARARHMRVMIFSNAPRAWVRMALSVTGIDVPDDDVIVADDTGFLKPQREAYAAVEARVPPGAAVTFVDDSAINLAHCPPAWDAVLFGGAAPASHGCEGAVRHARSMDDLFI